MKEKNFTEIMQSLPPRKARFVKAYLVSGVGTVAYKEAGYSGNFASNNAIKLLKDKKVAQAVAAGKAELAKEAKYDQQKAIAELDDAMQFARDTNNAGALAKCIELKTKLTGLLIDRSEHAHLGQFQVLIGGIASPAN